MRVRALAAGLFFRQWQRGPFQYSPRRKPRNSAIATPMMAAKTVSSRSNHVSLRNSRATIENQQREDDEGDILQPSRHLSRLQRGLANGSAGPYSRRQLANAAIAASRALAGTHYARAFRMFAMRWP